MRIVTSLGVVMVLVGAITFIWHVRLVHGAGSVPSVVLLLAGALMLARSLTAQHKTSRADATGLRHPTL